MTYTQQRTIKDTQSRDVTVTNDERGFVYEQSGYVVVLPAVNDAKALDLIGMHDAPPTTAVPLKVTRRQALQALTLAGKIDLVQPAIDAITDTTQRALMQIEWDDSQDFERHRASLVGLASAIGLSGADVDSLFVLAKSLP